MNGGCKKGGALWQKIFYDRSTNSAAFCATQWMSFNPPFPLCNLNN